MWKMKSRRFNIYWNQKIQLKSYVQNEMSPFGDMLKSKNPNQIVYAKWNPCLWLYIEIKKSQGNPMCKVKLLRLPIFGNQKIEIESYVKKEVCAFGVDLNLKI
jgi:hypothetical protein